MKNQCRFLITLLLGIFLLNSCSDKVEDSLPIISEALQTEQIDNSKDDSEFKSEQLSVLRDQDPAIIAMRDNYSYVLQDKDCWEVMLNLSRTRSFSDGYLYSFSGQLAYMKSYIKVTGPATAIYDSRFHVLNVCAQDSASNNRYLIYTVQLEDLWKGQCPYGDYVFAGNYYYHDKPTNMNRIPLMWIKGGNDPIFTPSN